MTFIIMFIFLGFLVFMNASGEQHPLLYLFNTLVLLYIATIDFSSHGNDWVNNLWGIIMFILAMHYANLYMKLRR